MRARLKESLNQIDRAEQSKIAKLLLHSTRSKKLQNEYFDESINNITNVLVDNGYEIIGEGNYRKVYTKSNVNFVIKVAKRKAGIESNSKEIAASHPSTKSVGVKKIIPHLYEYDRRHDPLWVICEKVKPIRLAKYEEIIKVFPTFLKAFECHKFFKQFNNNVKKEKLIYWIEDIYLYIVRNDVSNKSKIVEEIFKRFVLLPPKGDAQKIIKSGNFPDIDHLLNSTSYDYTLDLATRNLGIRNSGNPSPEDFMILDFDTQFKRWFPSNLNIKQFKKQSSFIDFFSDEREDESDLSNTSENIKKNIYLKLLKEFHDKEQDIASKLKEIEANPKSWSVYNDLSYMLRQEGYEIIGSGHSRVVFTKSDIPFVVKLATNSSGVKANNDEISLSNKESYSDQVHSILPELYSYSEDKEPMWIICEKVIPLQKSSLEALIKAFPTFYYFAKQKTLNDGTVIDRNLGFHEFLGLITNALYNMSMKTDINIRIALSIIKRECDIRYTENYDLKHILNTLPLLDIKRYISATSYDYTTDLHVGNLGIRNEKDISHNSFVILDFDTNVGSTKKIVRHIFDKNPDHPSHPDHDAKLIKNPNDPNPPSAPDWSQLLAAEFPEVHRKNESFTAEAIYERLIMEASKQKRSKNRSHPDDTYEYGWPEFDDAWFDAEGMTTWEEDREWTKQWYKRMGLMK